MALGAPLMWAAISSAASACTADMGCTTTTQTYTATTNSYTATTKAYTATTKAYTATTKEYTATTKAYEPPTTDEPAPKPTKVQTTDAPPSAFVPPVPTTQRRIPPRPPAPAPFVPSAPAPPEVGPDPAIPGPTVNVASVAPTDVGGTALVAALPEAPGPSRPLPGTGPLAAGLAGAGGGLLGLTLRRRSQDTIDSENQMRTVGVSTAVALVAGTGAAILEYAYLGPLLFSAAVPAAIFGATLLSLVAVVAGATAVMTMVTPPWTSRPERRSPRG